MRVGCLSRDTGTSAPGKHGFGGELRCVLEVLRFTVNSVHED